MTDEIRFQNKFYQDAVDYTQSMATEKHNNGYIIPPDAAARQTVFNCQQNNVIIAMLTDLHYKVQALSIQIERLQSNAKINETLDNITKNLENLSLGKKLEEPPKVKKILYFGDKIPGFEGKGTIIE